MRTRHTFLATLLVALLALAGVTAAIAADPADPPPPRIAFVANGRVPADALAAGPIAGQLGAPVYTTEQNVLPDSTADALDDYNPELVIVMGGSVAISDDVVDAIAAATGLPAVDPTPPPTTGVVRAAGADRFVTATVVADLLSAYDPAYLGVDLQAVDADLLDGKDSTAFLGKTEKAADADRLDGLDSTAFARDSHDHQVVSSGPGEGVGGLSGNESASLATVDISLPDECAGEADSHNVLITGTAYINESTAGELTFNLRVDGSAVQVQELAFEDMTGQTNLPVSMTTLVPDLDAGTHTIDLFGENHLGDVIGVFHVEVVAQQLGWSCSAGAAGETAPGSRVSEHDGEGDLNL